MQVAPIIEAQRSGLRHKAAKHEYLNPKSYVRDVRDVSNLRFLSLGLVSDFVLQIQDFHVVGGWLLPSIFPLRFPIGWHGLSWFWRYGIDGSVTAMLFAGYR